MPEGLLPPDFPFAPPPVVPVTQTVPMQVSLGGGEGTLGFVVWPTHAGCVNQAREEPLFKLDYHRGQIFWDKNDRGIILGRATVLVPAGEWCWVIYCYNPYHPSFVTAQKLAHPLILHEPGTIELSEITEAEVTPLKPDPVLHD